jgi:hypothetical protein
MRVCHCGNCRNGMYPLHYTDIMVGAGGVNACKATTESFDSNSLALGLPTLIVSTPYNHSYIGIPSIKHAKPCSIPTNTDHQSARVPLPPKTAAPRRDASNYRVCERRDRKLWMRLPLLCAGFMKHPSRPMQPCNGSAMALPTERVTRATRPTWSGSCKSPSQSTMQA